MKAVKSIIVTCNIFTNNGEEFKEKNIWHKIWYNRYVDEICKQTWREMINIENKKAADIE